jgi:hypothetical protein
MLTMASNFTKKAVPKRHRQSMPWFWEKILANLLLEQTTPVEQLTRLNFRQV